MGNPLTKKTWLDGVQKTRPFQKQMGCPIFPGYKKLLQMKKRLKARLSKFERAAKNWEGSEVGVILERR